MREEHDEQVNWNDSCPPFVLKKRKPLKLTQQTFYSILYYG